MANPEINRLMAELSQILERNRQQRMSGDAISRGFREGQTMAQARQRATGQQQAAGQAAHEAAANANPNSVQLEENAAPMQQRNPTDQAILDERRKRFMQAQALAAGRPGPLGGAGMQPPQQSATQAPFGPQGYQPPPNHLDGTGGLSPDEMSLLEVLSRRNPYRAPG